VTGPDDLDLDDDEPVPQLDPDVIEDDQLLAMAVDAVMGRDSRAKALMVSINDHGVWLRGAVDADTWQLVLRIDELATERWSDLTLVLVRWAFAEGRRWPLDDPEARR
jgi:hypothetical protein